MTSGAPPVTFVIWNVYATGGTVRTVVRQANALAERGHDVTVVSVMCHHYQKGPFFQVHPDVQLEILVDRHHLPNEPGLRGRVRRALDDRPVLRRQFSVGREAQASLLTDVLLLGRIARERGIVIGTRIGINLAIARLAHPVAHTIAQEHLQYRRYAPSLKSAISRHFPELDLVTSLTHTDGADYARVFPERPPRLAVVPNAIPDRLPEPADPRTERIVCVSRLAGGKAHEDLIDAFAAVAADHPTWELRLVGSGPRRKFLAERIAEHGLEDRIVLAGAKRNVDAELADASVFALSSRFESFGLVILEAMAAGLAVVSYATPIGPTELVDHGSNGLLAPLSDVDALADRLDQVMGDADLRRRLAAQGRRDAEGFTLTSVTDRWERLFADLVAGDGTEPTGAPYVPQPFPASDEGRAPHGATDAEPA